MESVIINVHQRLHKNQFIFIWKCASLVHKQQRKQKIDEHLDLHEKKI